VGTSEQGLAVLHVGSSVGWVALKGVSTWSREISVVVKAEVSEAFCRELGITLPESQPEAARLPNARRAALASTLVAVEPVLVDKLVARGVRVHTVGSDRITGGFYYFAKGGTGGAVRVQGNLVEMVAPALASSADNATLEATMDGLIGRILGELSEGVLSEAAIELAGELPALGELESDAAAKLQTLEGLLVLTGTRASRYEERARAVVDTVGQAGRQGKDSVSVPLFGDAIRVVQPELQVEYADGDSGAQRKLTLPERSRWFVAGLQTETMPPPEVVPNAEEVAAERAAAEKAAAEKAAAQKAAAEKAAAEKAAAEKAAAEKAAAERAAAQKAAAEKAAAEKAAAEKAAAEKAAAAKAAAEKAAAEKAAAEKVAAEKVAAEKAAREKSAGEKVAAEKAAAKKTTPEKAVAEKATAKEKRPATDGKGAAPQAVARMQADQADKPTPVWVWLLLLLAVIGAAYYFAVVRHHG
jgi:hypothetical protein